jgi:FO synthase subunit 2
MSIALWLQTSGGTIQKLRYYQDDIQGRIEAGKCTMDDALVLYKNPSFLLSCADSLRRKAVGDAVTYVINRNINFTNRCIGTCRFCAFKNPDGYILEISEILEKTRAAVRINATEICIQGGLLPDWDVSNYCEILESIREEFPRLHIHAYSPMEVFHAARNSNISVKEALSSLKKAGLGSMPGTAAEILVDRVREEICPEKLTTHEWIDVVRSAHRQGIPTTATIMYGHIETLQERIEHIFIIREIQKKTGGFTEFVPLPFLPHNNRLGGSIHVPRGIEDLKLHALARVLLYPHIKNIQASWVKLGKKMAQAALDCGANDLGGTLMEENISKSAGAMNGEYMTPEEFDRLIREIKRVPQQRDTLYGLQIPDNQLLK